MIILLDSMQVTWSRLMSYAFVLPGCQAESPVTIPKSNDEQETDTTVSVTWPNALRNDPLDSLDFAWQVLIVAAFEKCWNHLDISETPLCSASNWFAATDLIRDCPCHRVVPRSALISATVPPHVCFIVFPYYSIIIVIFAYICNIVATINVYMKPFWIYTKQFMEDILRRIVGQVWPQVWPHRTLTMWTRNPWYVWCEHAWRWKHPEHPSPPGEVDHYVFVELRSIFLNFIDVFVD